MWLNLTKKDYRYGTPNTSNKPSWFSGAIIKAGTYIGSISDDNITFNVCQSDGSRNAKTNISSSYDICSACLYIGASGTTFNNKEITLQIEKGSTATTYEAYTGASYQLTLGSLELNKIGTYQDRFLKNSGKNLFNLINDNLNANWDGGDSNKITIVNNSTLQTTANYSNWRAKSINIPNIKPSTTYSLSVTLSSFTSTETSKAVVILPYNDGASTKFITFNGIYNLSNFYNAETQTFTFTTPSDLVNMGISLSSNGASTSAIFSDIMLNEGSTALPYEPYGTNEWYLHKEIGKVVLDGSFADAGQTNVFYTANITDYATSNNVPLSNYYNGVSNVVGSSGMNTQPNNTIAFINISGGTTPRFYVKDTRYNSSSDFNNWLANNNLVVNYALATPTYTQITDDTLISQLEAVHNAKSYKDQTNINQVNDDLPFEMKVKVKVSS